MVDEYPLSSEEASRRVAAWKQAKQAATEVNEYVPTVLDKMRTATDADLATCRAGRTLMTKAQAHGWTVWPTFARVTAEHRTRVDEDKSAEEGGGEGYKMIKVDGELKTIAFRMSRSAGRERAVAVYAHKIIPGVDTCKWAFDLAYCWGEDRPIGRVKSTELAAYLIQSPVDQVVESSAA